MTTPTGAESVERRTPLNRDRVLQVAIELADRDGLEALSMRKLGQELGVDAMALYRHVRNKDDLTTGSSSGSSARSSGRTRPARGRRRCASRSWPRGG